MIDGKTDKVLSLVLNNMSGGVFIWRKGKTDRLRFVLAPTAEVPHSGSLQIRGRNGRRK